MLRKYSNSVKIRYPPSEKRLIDVLESNISRLIEKVPSIRKIILFGSYSRNKAHFGSDVDLLFIVEDRKQDDFEKIYELLFEFSLEFEWAPLIIAEKRFKALKKERHPFLEKICRDGRILYDADKNKRKGN